MEHAMTRHRHTELQSSECELDADPLEAAAAAELVRRATRGARAIASAALLLAAVASCGMALVLYRVHVASFAQAANTPNGVILEDAEMRFDEAYGEKMQIPGYYRVFLNTVVRKERDIKSEQVRFLSVGDTVYITEKRGRRVKIISPTRGWMSLETTDGVRILRPDLTLKGLKYSPNASALAQVFKSKAAKDAAEKAMKSAAEFTKLEDTLVTALKNINKGLFQKPGETLVHALKSKQMKDAGQIVRRGAMQLSKEAAQAFVVQKRGVEHMLKTRLTKEQKDRLAKDGDQLLGEMKEALQRHKEG